MIGASPFVESVWLVVGAFELQLILLVVFPAVAIGVAIKFMRNLGTKKDE